MEEIDAYANDDEARYQQHPTYDLYGFYVNDQYICDVNFLAERVVKTAPLEDPTAFRDVLRLQVARVYPPVDVMKNVHLFLNEPIKKIDIRYPSGKVKLEYTNFNELITATNTCIGYDEYMGPRVVFEFDAS